MSLAVYRRVRTLPDPELDALAELGRLCKAEAFDLGAALELAAFERAVRGEAGPGSPAALATQPAPSTAIVTEGKPALTKACQDCGKVRVASCRSALGKMGPRCHRCNGRYNLGAGKRSATDGGQEAPSAPGGMDGGEASPGGGRA